MPVNKRVSDETIAITLKDTKGNLSAAAERLGYERQSLYERIEKSDMLKAARTAAFESRCDMYESLLDQKANSGDINAIKFFLATQGKKRGYTEKQEIDVTSSTGVKIVLGEDCNGDD